MPNPYRSIENVFGPHQGPADAGPFAARPVKYTGRRWLSKAEKRQIREEHRAAKRERRARYREEMRQAKEADRARRRARRQGLSIGDAEVNDGPSDENTPKLVKAGLIAAAIGFLVYAFTNRGRRYGSSSRGVSSLSGSESRARIAQLHAAGYRTKKVRMPDGTTVVLRSRTPR